MNRSILTSPMLGGIALVLGALSMGCAATPRPKSLDDASAMLAHSEAEEVAGLRPALVAEAQKYLRRANEAYSRGDHQEAALYAQMAINRYSTARNLVKAGSARKLAKITGASGQSALSRTQMAQLRQDELRRFQGLESRIADIGARLDREPEGDSPEVTSAKQALVKARRKQAEAIGAGAAAKAASTYQQGASLIGTAVESLELGIYGESKQASAQALVVFEKAIAEASAPPPPAAVDADAGDRSAADAALSDASEAQALALSAGAPSKNGPMYQRGTLLMASAQRRFDRDDFRGALRSAREAKQAFDAAMQAPSPTVAVTSPGGDERSVDQILVALRFKRAELLGAGKNESCGPTFREFDAILELAGDRLKAGDLVQAREFAIRAEERVRRCEDPRFGPVVAAPIGPTPDEARADAKEALQKQRAAAALQRVQMELAKARGRLGNDERLAKPATLVTHAEKWFDRGSYDQSEQLSDQAALAIAAILAAPKVEPATPKPAVDLAKDEAAKTLQRAQTVHAELVANGTAAADLRLPEQHLASAERWFDRGRFDQAKADAEKALALFAKISQKTPKTADRSPTPLDAAGQKASVAIDQAKDARMKALLALVDEDAMKRPDKLLELAEKSFADKRHEPATLYADKARQEYDKLVAAAKAPQTPQTPVTETPSGDTCKAARSKIFHAKRLDAKVRGPHLSEVEKSEYERGSALATVAQSRLEEGECDRALELAEQSAERLMPLPLRPGWADGTKKPTKKPGKKSSKVSKTSKGKPTAPGESSPTKAGWKRAYEKTVAALRKRDEAKSVLTKSMTTTYDRGLASLAAGRQSYEAKRYADAERHADVAIAQFEAVVAASGGAVAPTGPATVGVSPKPGAAPSSSGVKPTSSGPWADPYRVVYRALKLRDRAKAAATTPGQHAAVARGSEHLTSAKGAWSSKRFDSAESFARAAISEFRAVIDGETSPAPAKVAGDDRDPAEVMKAADAAVREAKVFLQVCERDKCDERDFAEFTRAKELLASAEKRLEAKDYPYAEELGKQAKDKLAAILAKPRPDAPPAPKSDAAAEQRAKTAIDEAAIALKLCEARKCNTLDLEAWLRAQQNAAAAKSALADGDAERAERLANKAIEGLEAIQAPTPSSPAFVVPSGVTRVTRSGSQLYLNPPVDFRTGSTNLDASSKDTVADLATVLKSNRELVEKVRITGYTDSRGNANLNKNLSARRARALLESLVGQGVDRSILVSEGRGADNPIADNSTAEGRKANRRVEVHVDLR